MSLTAVSLATLTDSISNYTSTAASTNTATADTAGTLSGSVAGLTSSLLQALASGNTADAQSDVSQLQQALNLELVTGEAGLDSTSTGSTTASTPFDQLLSSMQSSLTTSGNTEGALSDLSTYLTQNGSTTGNVINASA